MESYMNKYIFLKVMNVRNLKNSFNYCFIFIALATV